MATKRPIEKNMAANSRPAAGYSKRSLPEKLNLVAGMRAVLINPPKDYRNTLVPLPENITFGQFTDRAIDWIQAFMMSTLELEIIFPRLKAALTPEGILWISWPKKAARMETDLTENVVREIGLANGLVDVKVAAIDVTWSALKFVYRFKDRSTKV